MIMDTFLLVLIHVLEISVAIFILLSILFHFLFVLIILPLLITSIPLYCFSSIHFIPCYFLKLFCQSFFIGAYYRILHLYIILNCCSYADDSMPPSLRECMLFWGCIALVDGHKSLIHHSFCFISFFHWLKIPELRSMTAERDKRTVRNDIRKLRETNIYWHYTLKCEKKRNHIIISFKRSQNKCKLLI